MICLAQIDFLENPSGLAHAHDLSSTDHCFRKTICATQMLQNWLSVYRLGLTFLFTSHLLLWLARPSQVDVKVTGLVRCNAVTTALHPGLVRCSVVNTALHVVVLSATAPSAAALSSSALLPSAAPRRRRRRTTTRRKRRGG
jgi:hypothetical protein